MAVGLGTVPGLRAVITMTLPWPPSVNHIYRPGRGKDRNARFLTKRALDYRDEVAAEVVRQDARPKRPLTGSLSVRVLARPPDRRHRDLDNVWKAMLDAIRHAGVIEDDRFIDRLEIERSAVTPDGEIVVTIARRIPNA